MKVYGVIIAGGQGKRLWPLSRLSRPKSVLAVTKDQSLIKQTVMRLEKVVDKQNIIIVTNEKIFAPVYENVKELPVENIISEPLGRNTAAAIGLACIHIMDKQDNAVVIVTPADHYIENEGQFTSNLNKAVDICTKSDNIVVFGVNPTEPSVNYGYIAMDKQALSDGVFKVAKFTEKPSGPLAKQFIADGYLWNAGIFVFRADVMINAIKTYMPELGSALDIIKRSLKGPYERKTIKEAYAKLSNVSIDKGIMEKLDNVLVIKMDTGWADLGSFEQIANIMIEKDENGNQRIGNGFDVNSANNIIISEDSLVVTANVRDLMIIISEGRVLVIKRDEDDTLSKIVNTLEEKGFKEYL